MDRFIAKWVSVMLRTYNNLKSNMDRFIVERKAVTFHQLQNLKSNMDRFIGAVRDFSEQ